MRQAGHPSGADAPEALRRRRVEAQAPAGLSPSPRVSLRGLVVVDLILQCEMGSTRPAGGRGARSLNSRKEAEWLLIRLADPHGCRLRAGCGDSCSGGSAEGAATDESVWNGDSDISWSGGFVDVCVPPRLLRSRVSAQRFRTLHVGMILSLENLLHLVFSSLSPSFAAPPAASFRASSPASSVSPRASAPRRPLSSSACSAAAPGSLRAAALPPWLPSYLSTFLFSLSPPPHSPQMPRPLLRHRRSSPGGLLRRAGAAAGEPPEGRHKGEAGVAGQGEAAEEQSSETRRGSEDGAERRCEPRPRFWKASGAQGSGAAIGGAAVRGDASVRREPSLAGLEGESHEAPGRSRRPRRLRRCLECGDLLLGMQKLNHMQQKAVASLLQAVETLPSTRLSGAFPSSQLDSSFPRCRGPSGLPSPARASDEFGSFGFEGGRERCASPSRASEDAVKQPGDKRPAGCLHPEEEAEATQPTHEEQKARDVRPPKQSADAPVGEARCETQGSPARETIPCNAGGEPAEAKRLERQRRADEALLERGEGADTEGCCAPVRTFPVLDDNFFHVVLEFASTSEISVEGFDSSALTWAAVPSQGLFLQHSRPLPSSAVTSSSPLSSLSPSVPGSSSSPQASSHPAFGSPLAATLPVCRFPARASSRGALKFRLCIGCVCCCLCTSCTLVRERVSLTLRVSPSLSACHPYALAPQGEPLSVPPSFLFCARNARSPSASGARRNPRPPPGGRQTAATGAERDKGEANAALGWSSSPRQRCYEDRVSSSLEPPGVFQRQASREPTLAPGVRLDAMAAALSLSFPLSYSLVSPPQAPAAPVAVNNDFAVSACASIPPGHVSSPPPSRWCRESLASSGCPAAPVSRLSSSEVPAGFQPVNCSRPWVLACSLEAILRVVASFVCCRCLLPVAFEGLCACGLRLRKAGRGCANSRLLLSILAVVQDSASIHKYPVAFQNATGLALLDGLYRRQSGRREAQIDTPGACRMCGEREAQGRGGRGGLQRTAEIDDELEALSESRRRELFEASRSFSVPSRPAFAVPPCAASSPLSADVSRAAASAASHPALGPVAAARGSSPEEESDEEPHDSGFVCSGLCDSAARLAVGAVAESLLARGKAQDVLFEGLSCPRCLQLAPLALQRDYLAPYFPACSRANREGLPPGADAPHAEEHPRVHLLLEGLVRRVVVPAPAASLRRLAAPSCDLRGAQRAAETGEAAHACGPAAKESGKPRESRHKRTAGFARCGGAGRERGVEEGEAGVVPVLLCMRMRELDARQEATLLLDSCFRDLQVGRF
ncbi:hypothetical protein BESB_066380 [Besnoitia besnoiti]|uniref:Uncharacterized protein n=1 Tax=Besnoitia besnoiti TaxID=94643 RepID=A0A2A9M9C9_BESBE|nr:hypothetical protein BESB_066380 [Besnoitia besnoiti]PFH34605.1 hypothetical protein BESB_066380 [Besnoitia besnoiti]